MSRAHWCCEPQHNAPRNTEPKRSTNHVIEGALEAGLKSLVLPVVDHKDRVLGQQPPKARHLPAIEVTR